MKHAIPEDWDHETFCKFSICWPDSVLWRALLRGLVTEPARGFFWDEKTGRITDVLADFRQTMDYNLELWEVIMACGDNGLQQVAQAINNLATATSQASAIANASASVCCESFIIQQQGGIQGTVTQEGTGETFPIYGTQPPLAVAPGEFPEGYNDLESYNLDKCQVANLIVDGLEGTLHGLAALGVFNAAAVVGLIIVAIVGLIVFPPALIPIAAAAIGVMSIEITILEQVKNQIEAHRAEWVCMFYKSDSVETALSLAADLVDGIVAFLEVSSPVGVAIKALVLLLLNSDTVNQLFHKIAHLQYPDADCSICELTLHWDACAVESFALPSNHRRSFDAVLDCENSYGCYSVYVQMNFDGSTFTDTQQFMATAISGGPSGVCSNWIAEDPGTRDSHNVIYYDTSVDIAQTVGVDPDQCFNAIFMFSDDPFSVTLEFTEC